MSDLTIGSPAADLGTFTEQDLGVDVSPGGATYVGRDTRLTGGKQIAPGVIWIENPQAIRHLLTDEDGPIGKWLDKVLTEAERLAKGWAPVDTGALRDSIGHEVRKGGINGIFGDLYIGVEYGGFQELGTSRNPPHPSIRPAVMQVLLPTETTGDFGSADGGTGVVDDGGG